MGPEAYQRLREAYHRLADASAEERAAGLAAFAAAEPDPEAAAELRRLLDDDQPTAETAGTGLGGALAAEAAAAAASGVEVPGYRIGRLIGAGGMGVVYEAEQVSPRRSVAIKLLRTPAGDGPAVRRFRREADALGRLDHPNVARILEAGRARTRGGEEPFIAMELVRGRPVDRHVREERPGVPAILELMVSICAGVEASHAVGVVHRDLKPANVLVDESGVPRILDFGIARLADETRGATITAAGAIVGTPAYLAPEQFEGGPAASGPAVDVYALGVMLFELLTGRLPFDVDGLPLAEVGRILRDAAPTRPSTLDGRLRGDLDVIIQTALAADPARRYPGVRALREDLERHLAHEPIRARPPSAWYRAAKFVRRHRALSGAAAAVLVVLTASTAALAVAYARAEEARVDAVEARNEAERQYRRSDAVLEFFTEELMRPPEGRPAWDAEVTLVEALDAAARRVDERFPDDRFVAGILHQHLGVMYAELGVLEKSLAAHRRAAELLPEGEAETHRLSGPALVSYAQSLADADRWEDAERVAREGYRIMLEASRTGTPRVRRDHVLIAGLFWGDALQVLGRHEEARPVLQEVARHAGKEGERRVELAALNILNASYLAAGDDAEALASLEAEVAASRAFHPPDHPQTIAALANLATTRNRTGDHAGAEQAIREVLAMQRRALPEGHWQTGFSMNTLAGALRRLGRIGEAAEAADEAFAIFANAYGAAHHRAVSAWVGALRYRIEAGDLDGALASVAAYERRRAAARAEAEDADDGDAGIGTADAGPPADVLHGRLDLVEALREAARPEAASLLASTRRLADRYVAGDADLGGRLATLERAAGRGTGAATGDPAAP